MGDVVQMPTRTTVVDNPGNGARGALIDVAMGLGVGAEADHGGEKWADWILMELWMRGYQVVPLPPSGEGEPV
jgi:hypothetical protein